MTRRGALGALLLLAACSGPQLSPEIAVTHAWARATAPGGTTSAAYLTIDNKGGEDRLVGISIPAGSASLHSTSMDGGVMRMRPLDSLVVPARSAVALEPGGIHIMLMGLRQPLTAGSTLPLELRFERSGTRQVTATVRPPSGASR